MEINVFCGLESINQVTHAIQESFTVLHTKRIWHMFLRWLRIKLWKIKVYLPARRGSCIQIMVSISTTHDLHLVTANFLKF